MPGSGEAAMSAEVAEVVGAGGDTFHRRLAGYKGEEDGGKGKTG